MARKKEPGIEILFLAIFLLIIFPITLIVLIIYGIIWFITFIANRKTKYTKYNKFIIENDTLEILNQVDDFEGLKFEEFVAELLYKNGYNNIEVTKGSGDFGADIIAEKDNIRYAFQCKRFNSTIGPKPIGEVLRGMKKYNCEKGIVITNNFFTNQAIQESKICDIELWDRNKLSYLIQNIKSDIIKKE